MSTAVFCIAKSQTQAEQIVNDLKTAGFSNNDVSALLPVHPLPPREVRRVFGVA
jgi:siderophore synthetase component